MHVFWTLEGNRKPRRHKERTFRNGTYPEVQTHNLLAVRTNKHYDKSWPLSPLTLSSPSSRPSNCEGGEASDSGYPATSPTEVNLTLQSFTAGPNSCGPASSSQARQRTGSSLPELSQRSGRREIPPQIRHAYDEKQSIGSLQCMSAHCICCKQTVWEILEFAFHFAHLTSLFSVH